MTTAVQARDLRRAIDILSRAAMRRTYQVVQSVAVPGDMAATRVNLNVALQPALQPVIDASVMATANWYEDTTALGWAAIDTPEADDGALHRAIGWATNPPGIVPSLEEQNDWWFRKLAGSSQRAVANASRRTIARNVDRDYHQRRVSIGYARMPFGGACAFCVMLASRGAVYHSARTAGGATRNRPAEQFHDHCRCSIVPVKRGEELPFDVDYYARLYQESAGGSTREVLARMRADHGLR
ncbi:hypothetical protein [Gryllotalpicola protaetiae]|uniref:Phage head morphogenesis domain-containing protein n=1 Tax=Gryllotalpicola protaetiae TaxID=2419771 RepID=A0A387BEI1_9MICO|nr:hypothetical protein [Gryllotalpicola protaetiae]AYG02375.1 hypothetical protein D7I44_01720 [Gryllotalpicola protaetiae]